ncbi:unnamed protein product [Moneuplotes crassus]|uniref:Uncharacterized protein n=1 Tax=Euplotes crassus TaxID=5936 RepID=A0AAD1UM90_EUPCR|nr:unnamed protein product [Moneuplotes crassus]
MKSLKRRFLFSMKKDRLLVVQSTAYLKEERNQLLKILKAPRMSLLCAVVVEILKKIAQCNLERNYLKENTAFGKILFQSLLIRILIKSIILCSIRIETSPMLTELQDYHICRASLRIVQNALPFGALATLFNFDSFEFSEWSKYKEECEKPNPDFSGIKIPPGFKNQNISKEAVDFLRKHGKEHVAILRDIRVLVRSLVKIRNKLLIKFQEFIDSFDNSDYRYGKVDHVALKKKWEDYREKGIDLFRIMKIKKKDPDAEYKSEVEMTEFDDEDSPFDLED